MDALRGHRKRHIMDGFPFRAGSFRHRGDFLVDPSLTPICASVTGRPTRWQKPSTVSISSIGLFCSTSCARVPKATFSP